MKSSYRPALVVLLVAAGLLVMTAVWTSYYCPAAGIAFSRERREFHRLKNRAALPQTSDFDSAITLAAILQPGADDVRWSHNRAARIEGYVVAVGAAGVELANCYAPCRRDTHINLALRPDAPASEQMVVEITPRMQDWARQHGRDWSPASLKRDLLGHWCSFEGWLFFDVTHAGESENTAPRRAGNWRATAWEIHPVTNFQIIY